jgi:hypothetical protein
MTKHSNLDSIFRSMSETASKLGHILYCESFNGTEGTFALKSSEETIRFDLTYYNDSLTLSEREPSYHEVVFKGNFTPLAVLAVLLRHTLYRQVSYE